ncbi:MAG: hypothetical protein WCX71_04900 [Candidatus Buchananbacteria bacterium]
MRTTTNTTNLSGAKMKRKNMTGHRNAPPNTAAPTLNPNAARKENNAANEGIAFAAF